MKPLNFIEPNSSTFTPSLKRWKKNSCTLLLIVLTIVLSIEAHQLYSFYNIKKEHTALAGFIANQKQIIKDKTVTDNAKKNQKKPAFLSNVKKNMPHRFIEALSSLIPDSVMVLNIVSDEKKQVLTLKGQALDSQGITQFLRALGSYSLFKKVTLTHLLKDTQHLYSIYELEINY
ncbi:PilN domain-containing protein [Candidatus Dependentiae bacterium]|nr:PilN domain-containing protein [Candidatus Dependentiae bacterium]